MSQTIQIEPQLGDMLCIRYGQYEWGFSGDRFHSMEGDLVTSSQNFANGEVRFSKHHKDHFRVLRGAELFYIK